VRARGKSNDNMRYPMRSWTANVAVCAGNLARGPFGVRSRTERIEEAASGRSPTHVLRDLVSRDRFHWEGAEAYALIRVSPRGAGLVPETVLTQGPPEVGKSRLAVAFSGKAVFARSYPGQAGGASPHHGDYCRLAASIMIVSPKTPTPLK
jgi:hypothetical protein